MEKIGIILNVFQKLVFQSRRDYLLVEKYPNEVPACRRYATFREKLYGFGFFRISTMFILTSLFLIDSVSLSAQVSHGGKPRSFQKNNFLQSLSFEKLSYQDNQILLESEATIAGKEAGFQFGKEIKVNYTLENSGVWDTLGDGSRLWRLGIYSQDAYSLNLLFDGFYIPQGSNLFIYTGDKSFVMGSFTEENNNRWGNFATSLFPGDKIILEYYEPAQNQGLGIINLSTIVHGYKDFFFKKGTHKGAVGNCHININCSQGNNYQEVKRSVALILYGGSAHCSGTLINNTAQDGTPYLLTARHCIYYNGSYFDPSYFVFVFNYESSDCEGENTKTLYSYNGATLVASHEHSDFALLLMDYIPQLQAMPYYAGWDRRNIAVVGAVGIHHPNGDIKKISASNQLLKSNKWDEDNYNFPKNTHWEVVWDRGSTEGGSSGSGLFNTRQQIIGQLEGGIASCVGTQPNGYGDWYGKLSYSWTNGNSSDSNRLDYWLDPLHSGIEVLQGYDPASVNVVDYDNIENKIKVYPNPANDIVSIESDLEVLSCGIYAINGQCIDEISMHSYSKDIFVNHLPSGIYLLKIQTKQGYVHKKLIIQK